MPWSPGKARIVVVTHGAAGVEVVVHGFEKSPAMIVNLAEHRSGLRVGRSDRERTSRVDTSGTAAEGGRM